MVFLIFLYFCFSTSQGPDLQKNRNKERFKKTLIVTSLMKELGEETETEKETETEIEIENWVNRRGVIETNVLCRT